MSGGAVEHNRVGAVTSVEQNWLTIDVGDGEIAVNRGIGRDTDCCDVSIGLGEVQLQHAAEVAERQPVGGTLSVHGELVDGALDVGLRSWQGDGGAVISQRGRVESAEGAVACCATHVIEYGDGGGSLRGGLIEAAARCAVDDHLVAADPVEGRAVEDGLAVSALHRGAELRAVACGLLLAGGEY